MRWLRLLCNFVGHRWALAESVSSMYDKLQCTRCGEVTYQYQQVQFRQRTVEHGNNNR
jgi:hypothetical protein